MDDVMSGCEAVNVLSPVAVRRADPAEAEQAAEGADTEHAAQEAWRRARIDAKLSRAT